jgi:tRNA(Ile)-lysidine synthase
LEISSFKKDEAFEVPRSNEMAILDFDTLYFPLMIRGWEQGDYFYPLGMKQKKKISDFLIDEKINRLEKEKLCVLLSGNQIVWLIGKRIDNRFKITNQTNKILKINLL